MKREVKGKLIVGVTIRPEKLYAQKMVPGATLQEGGEQEDVADMATWTLTYKSSP